MKAEIRQRWIDELRSGNRKQAQTVLRSLDAFCCLGVLCDLHDSSRWKGSSYTGDGMVVGGMPPDDVLEAVGLSQEDADRLADKNDDGASFSEIADIIDTEIPAE